jgi:hypothetical protein
VVKRGLSRLKSELICLLIIETSHCLPPSLSPILFVFSTRTPSRFPTLRAPMTSPHSSLALRSMRWQGSGSCSPHRADSLQQDSYRVHFEVAQVGSWIACRCLWLVWTQSGFALRERELWGPEGGREIVRGEERGTEE